MEIVKFKNGNYGIRKRDLIHKLLKQEGLFRDFKPLATKWRSSDDKYFTDCQLESFEDVVNQFNCINKGVIDKVF